MEAFIMNTDKLHRVRLVKSLPAKSRIVGLLQACRRTALGLAAFSLALVLLGPAWAADGDLDRSFDPGAGVSSSPMLWGQHLYNDGSGKMMITGFYKEMGGYARTCLARINSDGSLDDSFNALIDSSSSNVNICILLNPGLANSQMLIVGDFSIPSNDPSKPPYYGLARLNWNGTVDDTFIHTFSRSDGVQAMGRQADGKIVVGGYGMKLNGYPDSAYYLVRLDKDGNVDPNYMHSAPGGNVYGLGTDQNVAGQVRLFGDIPRFSDPTHVDHMLLLNADGTSVLQGLGDEIVNGTILGMTWQGTYPVIYGSFTQITFNKTTTSMNGIARLLPGSTGLDPSFQIGTGANGHVKRAVNDGDKLVLNGYFNDFNGTTCGYMVRLNNNGSVDGEFNKGGSGADDRIWNVFKQVNGSWVAMGAFQSFNGSSRQCLATLDSSGQLTDTLPEFTTSVPTSSAKVYAIQDSPQGIYIAGTFSRYGGKLHRRVARVKFDGKPDDSFRAGIGGMVYSICTQDDGKLLIAGHFGAGTGYVGCTSLARLNLDGSIDLTFKPVLTKADGSLPDLYMVDRVDNGQIVIGGDFAYIANANHVMQPRTAIALLNPDGSLDPSVNAQISIPGGTDIRVSAGGRMDDKYVVGGYVLYLGSPAGFYTRLTSTGALDPTFNPASPAPHVNLFDGEVRCGTDTVDGRVVVGGDFTHVHDGQDFNIFRGHIARFTFNGLLDATFVANPGANNPVYYLQRQYPKDKIFIGGAFTSLNGVGRNYLALLNPNGTVDSSFDPKTGPDGPVYGMDWNNYIRRLRIVGAFTHYQDASRPRIAQVFASAGSFDPGLLLLLND
jgi:uncharacterized delta-60 repeat protein